MGVHRSRLIAVQPATSQHDLSNSTEGPQRRLRTDRHSHLYDFAPAEADERVETWLADAVTDPANGWTADELAGHVRQEYSTYSWLLEAMLDHAGFEIIDRHFRRSVYGTYTCRRRI